MLTPGWPDQVWRRAVARGLPPAYATRLVTELRDHAEELGAGSHPALGTVDELVAAAVAGYRGGCFAGRHPVLAFVVAPVLLAQLAWWLYLTLGIWFVEAIGGTYDPVSLAVAHGLAVLSRFLPPAVALGGLWWAYRRSGRPRAWFVAGGLLVAALAGWYHIELTGPTAAADPDAVVGFDPFVSWWQAGQFAAALALGWLLLRRLSPPAAGEPTPLAAGGG